MRERSQGAIQRLTPHYSGSTLVTLQWKEVGTHEVEVLLCGQPLKRAKVRVTAEGASAPQCTAEAWTGATATADGAEARLGSCAECTFCELDRHPFPRWK